MFDYDVWNMKVLGIKPSVATGKYTLTFVYLKQEWLKLAAKKNAKYKAAAGRSFSNLDQILYSLNKFSCFLDEQYPNIKPQNLSREIIINFLIKIKKSNLKAATLRKYVDNLDHFFQDC